MKITILGLTLIAVLTTTVQNYDYKQQGNDWTIGYCDQTKYKQQSPINIQTAQSQQTTSYRLELYFNPETRSAKLEKTGTNQLQVVADNDWLQFIVQNLGGTGKTRTFRSSRLQFHYKSEHTIDGVQYDLEMHVVSQETPESQETNSKDSRINAELSFLFKSGSSNEPFFSIVDFSKIGQQISMQASNQLKTMLSSKQSANGGTLNYYNYAGSYTSPNCEPTVHHFIFADIFNIGASQLQNFKNLFNGNSNWGNGNYRAIINNSIQIYKGQTYLDYQLNCGSGTVISMTDNDRKALIWGMNIVRIKTAYGEYTNLVNSKASNMNELKYSILLEQKMKTYLATSCPPIDYSVTTGLQTIQNLNAKASMLFYRYNSKVETVLDTAYIAITIQKQASKLQSSQLSSYQQNGEIDSFSSLVWGSSQYVGCSSLKYLRTGIVYDIVVGCMFWPNVNVAGSRIYSVGDPATNCGNGQQSSQFKGLCIPNIPNNQQHSNSISTEYSFMCADPYLSQNTRKQITGQDLVVQTSWTNPYYDNGLCTIISMCLIFMAMFIL